MYAKTNTMAYSTKTDREEYLRMQQVCADILTAVKNRVS